MSDANSTQMLGQAKGVNQNLAALTEMMRNRFPLGAFSGTFTAAAAASTVVTDANIKAGSTVVLVDANAEAATLQGSAKRLYTSARAPGTSFTVSTASGASAAGGEQFSYLIVNVG